MDHRNIDLIHIPLDEQILLREAGINPVVLKKVDNTNNLAVDDSEQILNVIGSYPKSVHSYKEIDHENSF